MVSYYYCPQCDSEIIPSYYEYCTTCGCHALSVDDCVTQEELDKALEMVRSGEVVVRAEDIALTEDEQFDCYDGIPASEVADNVISALRKKLGV